MIMKNLLKTIEDEETLYSMKCVQISQKNSIYAYARKNDSVLLNGQTSFVIGHHNNPPDSRYMN